MKGFLNKIHPHQHTLSKEVSFSGIGLHSSLPISLVIKPAAADSGIRFYRICVFLSTFILAQGGINLFCSL